MAPLTASPSSMSVGLAPSSPPRPPASTSPSPPVSTAPPSGLAFPTSGPSATGAGRGRKSSLSRANGSVQSRRSAISQGLGVQFAALELGDLTPSPRLGSRGPPSRSNSRSHSRRSSITSPALATPLFDVDEGLTSPSGLPPTVASAVSATRPSSRQPSRRPSLSHLASFLSGIEHHTRVRSPGVHGGRGVSRSASRSQSRASEFRRGSTSTGGGSDDEPDFDDLDDDYGFRRSSRRSSLTSARSQLHSLVRENTTGGSGSDNSPATTPSALADRLSGALGLTSTPSPPPLPASEARTFRALSTPRILGTSTDEEPYLDTAPSSPQSHFRQRTRTLDSNDSYEEEGSGMQGVDVFEEGERIGVGVWLEDRGGWITDCFDEPGEEPGNGAGGPGVLEVERRLGEGTYAIVYLVREVLYDPDPNDDDLLSPIDAFSSFQFDTTESSSSRPRLHSWGSDVFTQPSMPTYGRNFALKCLCKRDLTEDLIEVQRGEAVLHRALPDHPYIVRLYGAFENEEWLFLVLEYCPGQDLFYWLDERRDDSAALYDLQPFQRRHPNGTAHDSDDEDGHLSRTITAAHPHLSESIDHTPPNPYLLSSTAHSALLSRARLRLISRMFGQMCSAVQACHDVGISHRDIKPENFIVMDGRDQDDGGAARVVVKITDWGLGTREEMCEDFDCGSKPYMAYECRNNLQPTYDPRQADVWSLGLVLLNLLYHRNPWSDPRLDDPDFGEYVKNPVGFLEERFEGIGEEVATFLAENVFCDVLEYVGNPPEPRRRVSAGEFGRWAGKLVMMMGEGKRHKAGVSDSTFSLVSAAPRPIATGPVSGGGGIGGGKSLASMLAQYSGTPTPTSHLPLPHPLSQSSVIAHSNGMAHTVEGGTELDAVAEVEEDKSAMATPVVSPGLALQDPPFRFAILDDDDPLPSPSFSPPAAMSPALANSPPAPSPIELGAAPGVTPVVSPVPIDIQPASTEPLPPPIDIPAPEPTHPVQPLTDAQPAATDSLLRPALAGTQQISSSSAVSTEVETETEAGSPDKAPSPPDGTGEVKCWGEPEADTRDPKTKRRKRGARKSKQAKSAGHSPPATSPLAPSSPRLLPTVVEAGAEGRDQFLDELAAASQDLARELSKAQPKTSVSRSTSTPRLKSASASVSSLQSSRTTQRPTPIEPVKKAEKGGMFGRLKSMVNEGNPDLEAFRQRTNERNLAIGAKADTYSAPAKMQGRAGGHGATPLSSYGSVGTASWTSSTRSGEYDDATRRSPGHWNSTSSRRERIDKQRRALSPASGSTAQTAGTGVGGSGSPFESRAHTPLSSFSSVAESRGRSAGAGDWRQGGVGARPYSHGRKAEGVQAAAAAAAKPVMRDSAVDTADLGAPVGVSVAAGQVVTSTRQPAGPKSTASSERKPAVAGKNSHAGSNGSAAAALGAGTTFQSYSGAPPIAIGKAASTTSQPNSPGAGGAPPVAVPVQVPPAAKSGKLGKMFSVFNSGGVGKMGRGGKAEA